MAGLIKKNREEKFKRLYNATYELILEKGIEKVTIDQIVKKARVAKGTFYLYFEDKADLLDKLIYKKSYELAKEALRYTKSKKLENFD